MRAEGSERGGNVTGKDLCSEERPSLVRTECDGRTCSTDEREESFRQTFGRRISKEETPLVDLVTNGLY